MEIFAPRHLLIILLICLVVFGTKKLKTIGQDLGGAVRRFKNTMNEGEKESEKAEAAPDAARLTQNNLETGHISKSETGTPRHD